MFDKNSIKYAILAASILFASSSIGQSNNSSVQQAIDFLKAACVTSGSSLDITATGGGAFQLKSVQSTGVQGSVTLNKKELEGFADAASAISAQQASEMRSCMKPYIDKILASLLTNGAVVGPKSFNVTTEGYYFVTEEFDRMIIAAAATGGSYISLEVISRTIGLSLAKVRHYAEIAQSNGLGSLSPATSLHFLINRKGIAYSLSK